MNTLADNLLQLRKLKQRKHEAKKHADLCAAEHAEFEQLVWDQMEADSTTSQRAHGITFAASETHYAQVQDREKFNRWAEDNDESILERRERKAELNALVRRRLEDDKPLPPGVGFYTKRIIRQTAN